MARRLYADRFNCGHPRSPENSWRLKSAYHRCKQCHQQRKADYQQRLAEKRVAFRRPGPDADLSTDPAIQLYRAEKARRTA